MGTITKQGTISAHPTSYDTTHYSYASISSSYPITNAYTDSSSTSYCQVSWKTGSGAETYVYLRFDFSSIPVGATIKTITAKAKGYVNTTNSSRVTSRQMQLATGTTLKGSALTISNSTSEQTFSSVGSWTRSELQSAGVRFYVKRGTSNTSSAYNLRLYGATMSVTYEYEETTYTITVSNSTSTSVTPTTQDVVAGQSAEIHADSLSGITVTDNGTDVTSQFVYHSGSTGEYTIENRGDYGFSLSNGYYVSQNKGVNKTAAVCRIQFTVPIASTVTFTYINYAEEAYDFGVFGNLDVALSTDYYTAGSSGATITDSSYKLACNSSTYNKSTAQTLTYSNVSAGEHYIDVKFSKDDASAANNDTLQFQVSITYNQAVNYYAYTISNVQADHAIVVTQSGGSTPKIYVKTGNSTETLVASKYDHDFSKNNLIQIDLSSFNSGDVCHLVGMVCCENSGQPYEQININDTFVWGSTNVYVATNGTNSYTLEFSSSGAYITSSISTYDIYRIGQSYDDPFLIYKSSGDAWTQYSKVYLKVNGNWVEQSSSTWSTLFNTNTNYRKME